MSKGSKRRPENAGAVEANWPFGSPAGRRQVSKTRRARSDSSAARCPFCYTVIGKCPKGCGREHCPCTPLADCEDRRPFRRALEDPMESAPHGFKVLQRAGASPDEMARRAGVSE